MPAPRAALLVLLLAPAVPAADWPRFRGPDGSGTSPDKDPPLTWGRDAGVAWKADLPGPGASSPVVVGDRVFVTCWTGFAVPGRPGGAEADLRLHLVCLDRRSGKVLWDREVPAKGPAKKLTRGGEGYASATPAADADRVYCFFGPTGVFAFDHAGTQLWRADVGDRQEGWASAASPVLHGGLVIVNASVEAEAVVALDKATGKERWRARGVREAWNTPLVMAAEGGREELVVPAAGKVFGLDPATGNRLWSCATDIGWYMVPSPVAHAGVAYCLGGRSGVVGVAVRAGGEGDVTATRRLWTTKKGSNVSSPVYHGGHLYWMNDASGTAYCAKAGTGEVVYEERVPRAGEVYASALLAGGRVYYVGRDGRTFVVPAAPRFELLATNDLGDRSDFDATPAAGCSSGRIRPCTASAGTDRTPGRRPPPAGLGDGSGGLPLDNGSSACLNGRTPLFRPDGTSRGRPAMPPDPLGVTQKAGDRSAPPGTLGGFLLVRRLGAGGMGEVWEADDPSLGRRVAVKVMRPEVAAGPRARERFLREARSAARVEHDHVVTIHHVGDDAGTPYLVMPLLAGETLEARLGRGPLPPAEVVRVGREAAAGLAAAHAKGVVHRDIKPSNLWLEAPSGRVKVLDFGLARAADPADGLSGTGPGAGTPAYMAPEQADGKEPDPRADLFSLGAVLYRCATGKPAFDGPTVTAILKAVALHDPPAPHELTPAVPRGLSDLIMRLLTKDPARRPANAGAVAVELAALAAGDTVPARPDATTLIAPPPTPPVRTPRRLAVGCTVAATLCLLVVVAGWRDIKKEFNGHRARWQGQGSGADDGPGVNPPPRATDPPGPVTYRGSVDVLVEREVEPGRPPKLVRLDDPRALPLWKSDTFRVEGEVSPPAYLYVVWVDPGHDITPVYPWDPAKGWGSRPAQEQPVGTVSRPPNPARRYTAEEAKPGVATMVLLACPAPLAATDDEVRRWFETLPDLPLPAGGEKAAVWFDDYREVTAPGRSRSGFRETDSADPFARWQGALRRAVGDKAAFQSAVSFARTGGK